MYYKCIRLLFYGLLSFEKKAGKRQQKQMRTERSPQPFIFIWNEQKKEGKNLDLYKMVKSKENNAWQMNVFVWKKGKRADIL